MSTLPTRLHTLDLRSLLKRSWAISPALTLLGIAMIITLVLTSIGIFIDPRVVTGAPVWAKPAKFAIATTIYSFTLVWLLQFVQGRPRLVRLITDVTTFAFVVEMIIILLQAARGTTSHFNLSTPLDAALYKIMGAVIIFLWLVTLLAVILLLFQRLSSSAFAWALRLGLLIALIGMSVGFLMVGIPSHAQQAAIAAGHVPSTYGTHSIGVDDGGPGLPFLGWSMVGGDLRIAHFFGLHGLQVLIVVGLLLVQFGKQWGLSQRHQAALVWTAGVGYTGLVALLTWQALRGQSIIAPDALTLGAFALLIGGVVLAVLAVMTHASMQRRTMCAAA